MPRYPSAIGPNTFMLATATSGRVTVAIGSPRHFPADSVPAQLMRIDDVTAYQAGVVRDGLRASGGTAVFVRYGYDMGCGPALEADGAFDSVGVHGLYAGRLRPKDRWINGHPTFDIFHSRDFPLPDGLVGGIRVVADTAPTMTAEELFQMYQTLWAESVSVHDRSVEERISRWLTTNPIAARKRPTEQVTGGMLLAVSQAMLAANPIPLGGTYAISIIVPGIDSVSMYGRTSRRARTWIVDPIRDSSTGVIRSTIPRSFAIDITTANVLTGSSGATPGTNPCSPVPMIFDQLPRMNPGDSTWSGGLWPRSLLDCAPPASMLHEIARAKASPVTLDLMPVRFRRHADGRITFDGRAMRDGEVVVVVRGERVAAESDGPSSD